MIIDLPLSASSPFVLCVLCVEKPVER